MTHLPGGTVRTTSALLGVTYTFDVLRLVPYIQTGVGVINFGGAVVNSGTAFDAELGLGADYLLTRRWAVGGVLQYQFTPGAALRLADGLRRDVVLLRAGGADFAAVLTMARGRSATLMMSCSGI